MLSRQSPLTHELPIRIDLLPKAPLTVEKDLQKNGAALGHLLGAKVILAVQGHLLKGTAPIKLRRGRPSQRKTPWCAIPPSPGKSSCEALS